MWFFITLVTISLLLSYVVYDIRVSMEEELKRYDWFAWLSVLVITFNIFFFVSFCGYYLPLKMEPKESFIDTSLFNNTRDMLYCAYQKEPTLRRQFRDIMKCISHVSVYRVRDGRVPYLRSSIIPTAFVFKFDKDSVFVTSDYLSMSETDKSLVLIHECAHIGFGAKDYAYNWQEKYNTLTDAQHFMNADTFMTIVLNKCT